MVAACPFYQYDSLFAFFISKRSVYLHLILSNDLSCDYIISI